MKKPVLVTGLDIGSSKVSAVAAAVERDGSFAILAQEFRPSQGVSRGIFSDMGKVSDAVSRTLMRLRDKISRRPDNIYVNISGETIRSERSRGMIPISLRGREITGLDMARCVNVASTIKLPFDRDVIHRIVQNFSVDDQPWIKNPTGLYASRLACEVYVLTADMNHIQNIYKCVNDAGYDVKGIVFTGLADAESLLSREERGLGVLLLDMGASLAEISIFFEDALRDVAVVAFGTGDIKSGNIKESADFKNVLSGAKKRIDEFLSKGGRIASVVLTGGLAFTDGVVEALEEGLGYKVKIGAAKGLVGDVSSLDSLRSATAIGLARYAKKNYEKKAVEEGSLARRISAKVVDIFNNYF